MLLYTDIQAKSGKSTTGLIMRAFLRFVAANLNRRASLRRYLACADGWLDFSVGMRTESGSVECGIVGRDGVVTASGRVPDDADAVVVFRTDAAARRLLTGTPTDQIYMLLTSEMRVEGSIMYLNLLSFFLSLVFGRMQRSAMERERRTDRKKLLRKSPRARQDLRDGLVVRKAQHLRCAAREPGVRFLADPYLPEYSLDDFPRLRKFLDIHLTEKPEVCPEIPRLLTRWHREHGFEQDASGREWEPVLRKAHAYKYLMENREAIIGEDSLIAGTTTSKRIGCPVYPDGSGGLIWNELLTISHRTHNPFVISDETREFLHNDAFPYWMKRNFREWVRDTYGNPLCQQLDERYAFYFNWKQATISHTIPDFPKMLKIGAGGIIREIRRELGKRCDREKKATLEAMILCLEGLIAYGRNLSKRASQDALREPNPARRDELERLAAICARVPETGARTLDEAVNSLWITWVALHMESMNAGLSLGRLDQWLQPYFAADMKKLKAKEKRAAYVKRAIELIGHLFMRCTDHFPLTPDLANFYFGGSSSDQAITLGGVTPRGGDAVNDMTYVFLKVTEMLSLRDPNVNARYMPGVNSDAYLKRLCEVNLSTAATPSLHNDAAVIASLEKMGYDIRDIRDWSATGCVEPTLSHRHMGHTNMQMMNMVAALEMALNDGRHPLTGLEIGPKTGDPLRGEITSFEEFFSAFTAQLAFLVDSSIEYNHMLAEAHQRIRPTPLLSALIDGCVRKGRDATKGGATYNSSGTALIGLADVTDSLMAVKKLVFEEGVITLPELKRAVDANFKNDPALLALARRKVPLFGSGSDEAVAMANRVAKWAHDHYASLPHYRGGTYTTGFWSMSNHVAFGTLTGALPSGRLAGTPFTPGLTPQPFASKSLLDNIRDVARLDPANLNNNIAFNVKVVPSAGDSREKTVDDMYSYVKTFFELGGMQMQLNVVTSETLRDAMAHPEHYRNLIVRISGYNAYFVTLNRDMQMELIERAEYGI
ncbi:MAG TPA: pyruvate formate lyase family protein [Spirochaetota bacterium]|nr:pyruvate formate lyase family protein [Spirochaetota bacterium]HPU89992.1 pyruvate formate lyase family protein [Spirochaetota bacterium]